MFRVALVFFLRLFAPEVDASNVAVAEELGLDVFYNPDDETNSRLIEIECDETPISEQHYRCKERMRWALLTISNRESPGNWSPHKRYTGIHPKDSKYDGNVYHWAKKFGRVSWWCPSHWTETGFSTVGPHGLMYGYNVQLLEVFGNCIPTWALGLGPVSARIAGTLYVNKCTGYERKGKRSWCPTAEAILKTRKRARRNGYAKL